MTIQYEHTIGDLDYEVEIEADGVYLVSINTDLGVDPEDLYLTPPGSNPVKSNGQPNMVSFAEYLCNRAYQEFIDEYGSEKTYLDMYYGDMKYDEMKEREG